MKKLLYICILSLPLFIHTHNSDKNSKETTNHKTLIESILHAFKQVCEDEQLNI